MGLVAQAEAKGRELNIEQVKARLPKGPDGRPPSDWYVRQVMRQVGQFRIGKWNFVHEAELERWIASQGRDD